MTLQEAWERAEAELPPWAKFTVTRDTIAYGLGQYAATIYSSKNNVMVMALGPTPADALMDAIKRRPRGGIT